MFYGSNKLKISLILLLSLVASNSYPDFIIRVQSPGFDGKEIKKFDIKILKSQDYQFDLKPNIDYYLNLKTNGYIQINIADANDKIFYYTFRPSDNVKYMINIPGEEICPDSWKKISINNYYLCLKEESLKGLIELLEAVKNQRNSDVQKLLEDGTNPSIPNKLGFNALTLAITNGYPETVTTILETLAKMGKTELITELVNTRDRQGETPLQLANRLKKQNSAEEAYQKISKILQDNGAK